MSKSGANSLDVPKNGGSPSDASVLSQPLAGSTNSKRRANPVSGGTTSRSTKKTNVVVSSTASAADEQKIESSATAATDAQASAPPLPEITVTSSSTSLPSTVAPTPVSAKEESEADPESAERDAEDDQVFSLGVCTMTSKVTLSPSLPSSAALSSNAATSGSPTPSLGLGVVPSVSNTTNSNNGSTGGGVVFASLNNVSSSVVSDVATMALPGTSHRDPNAQQLLMLAEFSDGYSLRNLIEYLKASNTTTGRLIFSRDRITFVRSNYQATVLNEVVFRTYDLPRYIYNSDQPNIVFGANMNNIRPITRSIGKKDSARLFMQKGDTRLYIQIISQNAKALSRENVNVIVSQNVEPEGYDLEEYVRSVDRPNCSVPCHDFTKMCGAMNSLKCSYVTAKGFENGMTFIGMIEGNIFGRVDRFGECGSALTLTDLPLQSMSMTGAAGNSGGGASSQQPVIRISISIVKALSKINNLTSNGNIRMYFESDRPLKLVCNVGTYGQLNIYLKEEDNSPNGGN